MIKINPWSGVKPADFSLRRKKSWVHVDGGIWYSIALPPLLLASGFGRPWAAGKHHLENSICIDCVGCFILPTADARPVSPTGVFSGDDGPGDNNDRVSAGNACILSSLPYLSVWN